MVTVKTKTILLEDKELIMNKLIISLIGGAVFFASAGAFAADDMKTKPVKTDMKNKWTCTTNASASDAAADKKADDAMAKASSAAKAFSMAAKHCRDCTKITCEAQK